MKRTAFFLGMALVVLATAWVPEAGASGDFKVTLGVKAWYNSWEEKDEQVGGSTRTLDYGSSLMAGPSLTLRYKKVFLGASYLVPTTEYDQQNEGFIAQEWKRKDLDVIGGVMFVPSFGIFAGYKSIKAPFDSPDIAGYSGDMTIDGFGIGLLGNIPLGRYAAIYGNLAGMYMNKDFYRGPYWNGGTLNGVKQFEFDMFGASAELGVAVAFNSMVSMSLGAKGQTFSGNDNSDYNHSSTFLGATLGVNLTF